MNDFHRIKRLPPYVFEEVNRFTAAAGAGRCVVDRDPIARVASLEQGQPIPLCRRTLFPDSRSP